MAFALVLLRLVRRALVSQSASDLPKSYRGHDEPSRPLLRPQQVAVIFSCLALIGSNCGPSDPWHWSLKLVAQLFRAVGSRSVRSLHFHGPETIKKETGSATVFYVCFRGILSLAIFCIRTVLETPASYTLACGPSSEASTRSNPSSGRFNPATRRRTRGMVHLGLALTGCRGCRLAR